MKRTPVKIENCPIVESIFEIRYNSDLPNDAIFGVLYASVKEIFEDEKPESLPILQLPEAVRNQDPKLKYQAYYRLKKENMSLNIGPKSLTFSNTEPYNGWSNWSSFFSEILGLVKKSDVISKVERLGLRYVNVFGKSILDKINMAISINDKNIVSEPTTFRTEIHEDNLIKILQVANSIGVKIKGKEATGSIIDIDCITEKSFNADEFFEEYLSTINFAHDKEKELFYSLLSDDFIKELKPIYEVENE